MTTRSLSGATADAGGLLDVTRGPGWAIAEVVEANVHDMHAMRMERQLGSLAERCAWRVVVSFRPGVRLSVSCLTVLARLGEACEASGGRLVVAGLPMDACRLIRSTGLARRFVLAESGAEAVRLLHGEGGGQRSRRLPRLFSRPAA